MIQMMESVSVIPKRRGDNMYVRTDYTWSVPSVASTAESRSPSFVMDREGTDACKQELKRTNLRTNESDVAANGLIIIIQLKNVAITTDAALHCIDLLAVPRSRKPFWGL